MPSYKIVISDECAAKAEEQAVDAGWTVEMWLAWVAEEYSPPQEIDPDEYV